MNMESNDYYLCAFLLAKGYAMRDAVKKGKQWYFSFEDDVQDEEKNFYLNRASVNPQAYESARQNLKSLMSNHYNKNEDRYRYNSTRKTGN